MSIYLFIAYNFARFGKGSSCMASIKTKMSSCSGLWNSHFLGLKAVKRRKGCADTHFLHGPGTCSDSFLMYWIWNEPSGFLDLRHLNYKQGPNHSY